MMTHQEAETYSGNTRKARVAIIGVHGVADQRPYDTARGLANLIQHKGDIGKTVFTECALTIDVEPPAKPQGKPETSEFDETANIEYTKRKLAEFLPGREDSVYRTICCSATVKLDARHTFGCNPPPDCIQGGRIIGDDAVDTDIDVYEMYWADLSLVRRGVFHALTGLYHFLITLCCVAGLTLESGREALGDSRDWQWLKASQQVCTWVISSYLPVLNFCLVGLFVYDVPYQIAALLNLETKAIIDCIPVVQRTFGAASSGILAGLLVGYAGVSRQRWRKNRAFYSLVALAIAALVGGIIWWLTGLGRFGFVVQVLTCWLPSALLIVWLCKWLDDYIPGVRITSIIIVLYLAAALSLRANFETLRPEGAMILGMRGAELVVGAAVGSALLFFFGLAAMMIIRLKMSFSSNKRSINGKANRSTWTAILAVLIPGIVMAIANVGIWQAVEIGRERFYDPIPKCVAYKPDIPQLYGWIERDTHRVTCSTNCRHLANVPAAAHVQAKFVELKRMPTLLNHLAALPLPLFVLIVIVWSVVSAWLLAPSVAAESLRVPLDEESRRWFGNTQSSNFGWLRRTTECLLYFTVVLYLSSVIPLIFIISTNPPEQGDPSMELLGTVSTFVLSLLGIVFFFLVTGMLQKSVGVLRAAIDVTVDVANWLRQHPVHHNPCSRISARYVSLLRHLANRKQGDGSRYYDRVVIVAHSFGCVISADVLRYLQAYTDDSLAVLNERQLPIYFFTMGNPLRQQLGLRLPFLYGWAFDERKVDDKEVGTLGWDETRTPDPQRLLAVQEWVNGYCSGDYVGRHLWYDDKPDLPWSLEVRSGNYRREFCVGSGAHTHYWDLQSTTQTDEDPARRIAREVVRLVRCDKG